MQPDQELSVLVSTRHLKAINTNWKDHRWFPEQPDERDRVTDEELASWLQVFERPGLRLEFPKVDVCGLAAAVH